MALLSTGPKTALGMGTPVQGAALPTTGPKKNKKGFIDTDDPRFSDPYGSAFAMGKKKLAPASGLPAVAPVRPVVRDLSGGRKKSIYAKATVL